jgi:hypothetical protein
MYGPLQQKLFRTHQELFSKGESEMPAQSEPVTEAKLAWLIWQALEKLNARLWDRYQEDFLIFATEDQHPADEEDIPPEL